MRRVHVFFVLTLVLSAAGLSAQTAWSSWARPAGDNLDLEFRWRRTAAKCTAVGCAKDLQFRNLNPETVSFEYTAWSKPMREPGDDVKESYTATAFRDGPVNHTIIRGGDLVRVVVRLRR